MNRKGFSLVEMIAVIVLVGLLAAFGVPRLVKSVERGRAMEGFAYLSALREAEDRHLAREGVYTTDPRLLDVTLPPPKHFRVGRIAFTDSYPLPGWTCTLTRATSQGAYTITFTQDGFDPANSTITALADLNPDRLEMPADSY